MKIRKGFVSNSSSSSYICDVCGEDATGMDVDLAEWEMYVCENGHTFCESHMKNNPSMFEVIKETILTSPPQHYQDTIDEFNKMVDDGVDEDEICDKFTDYYYEARYELPSKFCPMCQMEHVTEEDLIYYLLERSNSKKEDIVKEIQKSFTDINDFKNEDKLKVHFRKLKLNEL
jgi:hypothetical protein